ncbi:PREDICTED: probable receptor-like protein kinase At5g18500 [Fragaria vesca subsp. vesca]|uniref:probable receptor-like protein kinase At5g18500 n=1 Tax=Fragaria vesca subsp. vesca TaxID=101020 RepID=UPI0002C359C5|nr:PREDICTED: probable receptor-like protein kinase At5g18500 [Fragaria vesca subsp. vesca]
MASKVMAAEAQKVVVIQDASKDLVSSRTIQSVLLHLSHNPGDELTILAVLHQVNNPSTLAGRLLGYRTKMDSGSVFGTNQKVIEEEIERKTEEYRNKVEITMITQICESVEIKFHMEVLAGPSPKMVAAKAAKRLGATWVILDRQMKKDKQFFMENLTCGISRMKRNNSVEKLRGPKPIETGKPVLKNRSKSTTMRRIKEHVRYDEMIPGSPDEELSPKSKKIPPNTGEGKEQDGDGRGQPWPNYRKSTSSSNDQLTKSSIENTETLPYHFQEEEVTTNVGREKAGVSPPAAGVKARDQEETYTDGSQNESKQHSYKNDWTGEFQADEDFKNATCTFCNNQRPKIGWKRDFTYAELQAATDSFSAKNYLSEGGFGSVYKGELNGVKIAVKQHKNASFQGEKEFKSEVHVLSKARHENLVMLLGSCSKGRQRLLVYEYVCNGSLDQHLSTHPNNKPLSWDKKIKIATGAAKGLKYLHQNNIIHRDVRPNNILVTHDYESLLGDFGLARTQHEDPDLSSDTTRVVGTLGYLAPEYAESGKVSTKTDVYAFGVILLQLITGIRPTDKKLGGKSLVGWARPLLKERNYPDLIDPRNADAHDVHQLYWMVRIAEKCLTRDPHKRLTMDTVAVALDQLNEANQTCIIGDFSPAHSESAGSVLGSSESHGGEGDNYISIDITPSGSYMNHPTGKLLPISPSPPPTSSEKSCFSIVSEQSTLDSSASVEDKR